MQDDGERVFVTSVPPLASSDLTPEEAKTTLWTWKDTEKLSERAAQKQKAISVGISRVFPMSLPVLTIAVDSLYTTLPSYLQ